MIKTITTAALASALLLSAGAANAATATATASAKILKQVTVTKGAADLDFKTIVVGNTGGNVTVAANAAATTTCAAALVCVGTPTAPQFTIGGSANEVVYVNLPASVSLTSGANSMTATLSSSLTGTAVAKGVPVTLDAAGASNFYVGGTLAVAGSQADGAYTGTFNVTVDY